MNIGWKTPGLPIRHLQSSHEVKKFWNSFKLFAASVRRMFSWLFICRKEEHSGLRDEWRRGKTDRKEPRNEAKKTFRKKFKWVLG